MMGTSGAVGREAGMWPAGARQERGLPARVVVLTGVLRRDVRLSYGLATILLLILAAVFAVQISPYDPLQLGRLDPLVPPSTTYLAGTDEFGRDIFSRLIHGARISLIVSSGAVALALLIGVPMGLVSGYLGGLLDTVIMRFLDAVLSFPIILLAILVIASLGPNPTNVAITVGVIYVPYLARLVRGSVLSLKDEEFVQASIVSGASTFRILSRCILPNCLAPIMVQMSLAMGVALLAEAALSYLGLGVQPPTPAWGSMLRGAQGYVYEAPWYVVAPGACIFLVVLAFNLTADGLRDWLDPHMRGR